MRRAPKPPTPQEIADRDRARDAAEKRERITNKERPEAYELGQLHERRQIVRYLRAREDAGVTFYAANGVEREIHKVEEGTPVPGESG